MRAYRLTQSDQIWHANPQHVLGSNAFPRGVAGSGPQIFDTPYSYVRIVWHRSTATKFWKVTKLGEKGHLTFLRSSPTLRVGRQGVQNWEVPYVMPIQFHTHREERYISGARASVPVFLGLWLGMTQNKQVLHDKVKANFCRIHHAPILRGEAHAGATSF